MIWTTIAYIIDPLLFLLSAITIAYMLIFAMASAKEEVIWTTSRVRKQARILFVTTACHYDQHIERTVKSVLAQDYDRRFFDMVVVGDNLAGITNMKLKQYPITFYNINSTGGSKVSALQYAQRQLSPLKLYDLVILLDPDETVGSTFLQKVNEAYQSGYHFMQFHRTDLDRSKSTRVLATTFEEINNSIFRIGHNNLGLSSALVGSAYALPFTWFKDNIAKVSGKDEEKEMEILLLQQKRYIDYMDHIHVYVDHMDKTSDFSAQRRRWSKAQWHQLKANISRFLPALFKGNYDLADKLFQWMLIPRIMLAGIIAVMCTVTPFFYWTMAIKWWAAGFLLLFSYALAIPDYLVDEEWQKSFRYSPVIILASFLSLVPSAHIRRLLGKLAGKVKGKRKANQPG